MADGSILDALDALKKLEESLKSRDAEFREREAALQEHGSKIEEDRRGLHQERTSPPDERGLPVGRVKRMRARGQELGQREKGIVGPEEEFEATRPQVLAQENSPV